MKLTDVEKFARSLAVEAGELIQDERNQDQVTQSFKDGNEMVTSADIAVDELRTIVEAASRSNQRVFVDDFTGLN